MEDAGVSEYSAFIGKSKCFLAFFAIHESQVMLQMWRMVIRLAAIMLPPVDIAPMARLFFVFVKLRVVLPVVFPMAIHMRVMLVVIALNMARFPPFAFVRRLGICLTGKAKPHT